MGYAYVDYTDLEDEEIIKDISKAQEAFKKLNVKDIKLFVHRPDISINAC